MSGIWFLAFLLGMAVGMALVHREDDAPDYDDDTWTSA